MASSAVEIGKGTIYPRYRLYNYILHLIFFCGKNFLFFFFAALAIFLFQQVQGVLGGNSGRRSKPRVVFTPSRDPSGGENASRKPTLPQKTRERRVIDLKGWMEPLHGAIRGAKMRSSLLFWRRLISSQSKDQGICFVEDGHGVALRSWCPLPSK